MLCSDNVDCVVYFSCHVDVLLYINHSPDFSNVYFFARTRYFVYFCKTKWKSLTFKIFQKLSFFWGLKNGCCTYSVSCWHCCFFYIWENETPLLVLFVMCVEIRCLTSVFVDFYLYLFYYVCFFVRLVSDDWILFVAVLCQRKLCVHMSW